MLHLLTVIRDTNLPISCHFRPSMSRLNLWSICPMFVHEVLLIRNGRALARTLFLRV